MSVIALVMALILFVVVMAILLTAAKFAVNEVPRKPKSSPLALPGDKAKELTEEST